MVARASNSKSQPADGLALDHLLPIEKRNSRRFALRYERHACRLLDSDNFHGGTKSLTDCLRAAGLIGDDDPEALEVTFVQVKVSTRAQEGTRIVIRDLTPPAK